MRVVLLAGGKSKRMGTDKMFLPFHNMPLIQWMIEKIIQSGFLITLISNAVNNQKIQNILPYPLRKQILVHEDVYPEKGPIGGIYSGLFYSLEPRVFVVAVDLPFFVPELMKDMERAFRNDTLLIPQTEKGYEPLFAIYPKSSESVFLKMIKEDNLKISNSYKLVPTTFYTQNQISKFDPTYQSFININTREDYEEIIRLG